LPKARRNATVANAARRYELLDGTIYAMRPAKPPHAGVVDFFLNRLRPLDPAIYQLRSQPVVEIEPDGSPQPDVALLAARADYYRTESPQRRRCRTRDRGWRHRTQPPRKDARLYARRPRSLGLNAELIVGAQRSRSAHLLGRRRAARRESAFCLRRFDRFVHQPVVLANDRPQHIMPVMIELVRTGATMGDIVESSSGKPLAKRRSFSILMIAPNTWRVQGEEAALNQPVAWNVLTRISHVLLGGLVECGSVCRSSLLYVTSCSS
jgi:hypothetical protein